MKQFKTTQYTRKVIEETARTCDKCGDKIERADSYDQFNSSFRIVTGAAFPGGDCSEVFRADFCKSCAPLIKTFLQKTFNVKFYTYSSDSKTEIKPL